MTYLNFRGKTFKKSPFVKKIKDEKSKSNPSKVTTYYSHPYIGIKAVNTPVSYAVVKPLLLLVTCDRYAKQVSISEKLKLIELLLISSYALFFLLY